MTNGRLLILSLACLALAACGREDAPAEEPVAVDQPVESSEETVETEAVSDEAETVLVQANPQTPVAEQRFAEGVHYERISPRQPTVGGDDKIEVASVFWYGCPHCYDLEPTINEWAAQVPPNVRFVRIPATWNNQVAIHAQIYYTYEVLAGNGIIVDGEAFHAAVFDEIQTRRNNLLREETIMRFFARFGVEESEFGRTWNSFEVAQKLQIARDLTRRYRAASVPAIVVNGEYRTAPAEAGSYGALLELINELVERVDEG